MAAAAAGGWCVLCASLFVMSVITGPVSFAADTTCLTRQVGRQPGPVTFTEALDKKPPWFRDSFYPLSEELQLTFRFMSNESRELLVEILGKMPGMKRKKGLIRCLTSIAETWKEEDGFDVFAEAEDLASRDAVLQSRSGGGGAATVGGGRMSGALTEVDDPEDWEQPPSQPVVVGPAQFEAPSLWSLLMEARKAGNDTGLWRLSLSGGDDLVLTAVPRLDPAETVSLLPMYGRRADSRPELVQLTFPASAATHRQLLRTPDEWLRTLPEREVARLSARTITAVSVEHAGDVTVTGKLAAVSAGNVTDAELETLVHSLLQRPLSPAELDALSDVISQHWPDESVTWSPTHISVMAAHRCELLAYIPLQVLLRLDADTVAGLLRSCQNVWAPSAGGGGGRALGRYVRTWLQKELSRRGALSGWSAAALSEQAPLLEGALPEELAQIGVRQQLAAGATLSFASLDRAQAQPVISRQLAAAAEDLKTAGTLYGLLRHMQPPHVRQLGRLRHQLSTLLPWLMNDREPNGQYATHLQFRLMLERQPADAQCNNTTAEDLARLGPSFYTVSLAKAFSCLVGRRLQLTPAQLARIASRRLEPMTCRLLMWTFMLNANRLLRGVPPELLGCLSDDNLARLRLRGLLDVTTVAQLVPAADYMLPGKRAELLEAARRLLRRSDGAAAGPAIVAGSSKLWGLAGPGDMKLLVPAVIARMQELALHVDSADLVRAAAEYPRSLLGQVLAHYRGQDGVWSTESLLDRRPGRRRPPHGPWVYLAGLSCADVAAVTPLDLPPIAEAYERQLRASGAVRTPLALCVCLQKRLVLYLQVRHAMRRGVSAVDARGLSPSELEDAPLHRMSVSEVRALPACVLLLMPPHYMLSLSREARLVAWLKIGRITWPDIATHLSVQQNGAQFRWVARQMLHDLNVTNVTRLTFEPVARLNQLLHFVDPNVIARIAPEAFREWIYTLRSGSERLVCRPHRAWASLVSLAFGPTSSWNRSTPYYLGSWTFTLNATQRDLINREDLRLAVDNHNAALFQELPDVIGQGSCQAVTFLEACRDLNDTSLDLRLLFEASRLAGVVGYPQPRARRSVSADRASPQELRLLGRVLIDAVRDIPMSDQVRSRAEERVEELVASLGDGSAQDEPDHLPFEFVTSSADRLSCNDLRAAGPATAAVRPHELAEMAGAGLQDLWSCLDMLGSLNWRLGDNSVSGVWQAVRAANGERLQTDNLVHVNRLVEGMTPTDLGKIQLAPAGGELPLTDGLSILSCADWRPDQLRVLLNTTLGVTQDPRTSRLLLYAEPQYVVALGGLLCGLSPGQLKQLFNGTRPHLYRDTAAAVGRLGGCPSALHNGVLETLAELAVGTFGPTSRWDEPTLATVGVVAAGLRNWQFTALPAEALRGLTPAAARRAAAGVLATGLTADQLRELTPPAARQLLAQPGLDTQQRDALRLALHGRRSVRAAADPPPDTASDAADEPHAEPEPEPESEPEPEPEPKPNDHHHHHHHSDDSEPETGAEPRAESGADSGVGSDDSEDQEEPDSQGVTQEKANSTAPARLAAARPALWLTVLVLAAPAA